MKTALDLNTLIANSYTYAFVTPGSYALSQPLDFSQKTLDLGFFRLYLTGVTLKCSCPLTVQNLPLYIEGGTIYAANLSSSSASSASSARPIALQGTLLVGENMWKDASLTGLYWAKDAI